MKNKKQILILGGLLLLWLLTFFIGGDKEDKAVNTYAPPSKRSKKAMDKEEIDFTAFNKREDLKLTIERDLFFLPQPPKPKPKPKPVVKPKPKPVVKPRPVVKPVVESDSVKIKREMKKIKFLGFYENGNDKNIFIQYMGQDYEFENQGEIEIFIGGKSYILYIELIDDSNIRIQEKTRNVYLNKGL